MTQEVQDRSASAGICLLLVIIGVVCLGFASHHAIWRYCIEAVPALITLVLVWQRKRIGVHGATGILLVWFVVFASICMVYWKIGHGVTGMLAIPDLATFSIPQIVLTVILAVFCLWGTVGSFFEGAGDNLGERFIGFVVFALLQIVAFWVSMQAFIPRR
jgi:hypothetical protein